MINTIGHRETERALQLGKLYTPQEALSIGLVDAVTPLEGVDTEAHAVMKQWLKIPGRDRWTSLWIGETGSSNVLLMMILWVSGRMFRLLLHGVITMCPVQFISANHVSVIWKLKSYL